jgi:glycosyltransferase involved in cell wall biosynthesis
MTTLVDATLVLRWGPQVPTGIPRVETAIVKSALQNDESATGLFCFDSSAKRFRMLRPNEMEFIRKSTAAGHDFTPDAASRLSPRARMHEIRSIYAGNPAGATDAYRLIAQYLTASPQRSGLRYQSAKALVRLGSGILRIGNTVVKTARDDRGMASSCDRERVCFVSMNTAYISEKYDSWEMPSGKIALLVYDTIALDYPEFAVVDPDRFKSAFRRFVGAASTLICISQATANSVRKWSHDLGIDLDGKTIRTIRLPSSLKSGSAGAETVDELIGKRFVAYCSTIEPRKNHLLLLSAWSSVARDIGPENLPMLVLIGRWGWKYDAVQKMLRDDETLRRSVRHYTYLPDSQLRWVYENAQYTVFPSFAEGWGLGAMESLDFGTPVVIANIAALAEATQGLMPALGPDDEAAWRKMISELARAPDALEKLRQVVRDRYVSKPNESDWDSLLAEIAEGAVAETALSQAAT